MNPAHGIPQPFPPELPPEASKAPLALLDRDSRLRSASDSLAEILGEPRRALEGRPLSRYCVGASAKLLEESLHDAANTDSRIYFALRMMRANGMPVLLGCCLFGAEPPCLLVGWSEELWGKTGAGAGRGAEAAGGPAGPTSSATETDLMAVRIRLQAVLDNAPIAIWTWENWKVTYFSSFWTRLVGGKWTAEDPERPHWADVLVP